MKYIYDNIFLPKDIGREDCISIGMKKKKRGKKFDSKSFSGTAPFHSFPSYDTHKSPI